MRGRIIPPTAALVLVLACGESPTCTTCDDAGAIDAAAMDASVAVDGGDPGMDAALPDAGALDAGTIDSGSFDAGVDAGSPPAASCEVVPGTCDDGVDDDDDGWTDCADSDCAIDCADRAPALGLYARMSSTGFDEPYRFELRGDGTCRWRTSSIPETWNDCTWEHVAPHLRLLAPGGAVAWDWVIRRREGEALRMYRDGRDWETRDYGVLRSLAIDGAPPAYVPLGVLEDGALNDVDSSVAGGFEVALRAGDRLVFSNQGAGAAWVFGPVVSATDPGPSLAPGSGTLAGYDVVAEAPTDGTYLVVTGASVVAHRFDASGAAYRYLLGDGWDVDEGYQTTGAAIGEVTGDARTDVVVAVGSDVDVANACSLLVYAQRADGSLETTPTVLRFAASCYSREAEDVEIHDLDGNGHDDVVLLANQRLYVSLADDVGTLGPFFEASEGLTGLWFRMVVLDDDGDAFPDAALVSTGTLRILGNDGSGSFTVRRTVTIASGGRHGIAAGDVNGDGRDDVFVVSGQGRAPFVNVVLGGATEELALTGYTSPDTGLVGSVGNLDCDPGDEIVLGDHALPILRVEADGSLTRLVDANGRRVSLVDSEHEVFVRDLDGDGVAELIQNQSNGIVRWFRTEAGWRRTLYDQPRSLNYGAHEMTLGDFDDDGCVDAVVPSRNLGTTFLRGFGCR